MTIRSEIENEKDCINEYMQEKGAELTCEIIDRYNRLLDMQDIIDDGS